MNRTGHAIVLGALVMLVLGTDWALERAFINYHPQEGPAVSEPSPPSSDSVASSVACEPADMPAAADSSREPDRSDRVRG
jgi:hypothetical protein